MPALALASRVRGETIPIQGFADPAKAARDWLGLRALDGLEARLDSLAPRAAVCR